MNFLFSSQYIIDRFEKPMLADNESWCTSNWVYLLTGFVGALTGIYALYILFNDSFADATASTLKSALLYIMTCWSGCAVLAFLQIPDTKYAIRRALFNFLAVTSIFFIGAILSVVAFAVICLMLVGLFMSAGAGSRRGHSASSSSDDDTLYDQQGNIHHKSSSISNDRIVDESGVTRRREADGTWSEL